MSDERTGNGSLGAARVEEDFDQVRDITVIGAGPVGMITSFWAGMREASARIVDSLPQLGGQLTTLYPEKWIFDVPGYHKVLAKDLVNEVAKQSIEQFDVPVHLETTALRVEHEPGAAEDGGDLFRLITDRGELPTRAIIIAGGHGAFEPKKIPGIDLTEWEGKGVQYLVGEKKEFEGKRVVIVGGGDSACDWVMNLSGTASEITLVHRRPEFRAHEVTVGECRKLEQEGKVRILTPHQVTAVEGNGWVERVTVSGGPEGEEVDEVIECDMLLPQLGFMTKLGPLAGWGLEVEKGAIVVDPLMKTNLEGIWACGDITTFDGKLKLIATGFGEAAIAVAQAVHSFRPEMKIQPKYSTNTGVPGTEETGQP